MVGGLVEQEQLRSLEQGPGEHDPALLAARQPARGRLEALREPRHGHAAEEPVEDLADGGVPRPFVVGPSAGQLRAHRAVGVEVHALADQDGLQPAGARGGPGVRRLGTGKQPQQGRLPGPVVSHHPNPLALVDAERHVAQH